MNEFFELDTKSIKNIYSKILDDESKEIFINRLLYSITNDYGYIRKILKFEDMAQRLKENYKNNKKLIIFGAGFWGQFIIKRMFADINWKCFVDNNLKIKEVEGLKVIGFDELKEKYKDAIIVISSINYNKEIYDQLISECFNKENLINFGEYINKRYKEMMSKEQYFEFEKEDNKIESFVDVGCLDGDSSKKFIKWCNGKYSNIWAFEPDPLSYKSCEHELINIANCSLYNVGLWDKETEVHFNAKNSGDSKIIENGQLVVKTKKLDDLISDKGVTFIKMDIEGAEYNALCGAENIIRKQKPRLAICVYHKPEDILAIPNLLLKYNPNYQFKLRHYYISGAETVLYAF